jgi:hypothetical protein
MKPSFIGLGAQKCATAWLYNMLKDHPDIEMVTSENGKKDLSFFNHFYDRGFEWYEKHFVNCNTNTFGEFSTSYLYNTDVPERIYHYSAEVKLIVSLRNPVERAFSNHKHEINLGHISGKNLIFENALQNNPMYLYQSLYYTHLSRWMQYFDKAQIFIILVNDLKEKPEKTIHDLYSFLGVDPEHKPSMLYQRIHETRVPQNMVLESSIKKASAFLKKIGGATLINYLKSKSVNRVIYKMNTQNEDRAFPPMEEKTKLSLLEYFAEENLKLSKLIDRDLSAWRI